MPRSTPTFHSKNAVTVQTPAGPEVRSLLLCASLVGCALTFALPAQAAPDDTLGPDLSEIVDLAQKDAASLLPFGKKAPPPVETRARTTSNPGVGQQAAGATAPPSAPAALNLEAAPQGSVMAALSGLVAPVIFFIVLLGGALLFLRKRAPSRHVRVMEVTALGKGRSVIVAEVAGKPVLLGVSEGGVNLLIEDLPIRAGQPVVDATSPSFLERIFGRRPPPPEFDAQMYDSTEEDDELRRKIAAHLAGGPVASSGIH